MKIDSRPPLRSNSLALAKRNVQEASLLKRDLQSAQLLNTQTVGKQSRLTRDDRVQLQPSEEKSTPAKEAAGPTSSADSSSKELEKQEAKFLKSFAQAVSPEDAISLVKDSSESLRQMAQKGGDFEAGTTLAAHGYNHAKKSLSQMMPGAGPAELRQAAKEKPEVARKLALMDSSAKYLRSARQTKQNSESQQPVPPQRRGPSREFLAKLAAERQKTLLSVCDYHDPNRGRKNEDRGPNSRDAGPGGSGNLGYRTCRFSPNKPGRRLRTIRTPSTCFRSITPRGGREIWPRPTPAEALKEPAQRSSPVP